MCFIRLALIDSFFLVFLRDFMVFLVVFGSVPPIGPIFGWGAPHTAQAGPQPGFVAVGSLDLPFPVVGFVRLVLVFYPAGTHEQAFAAHWGCCCFLP